MTAKHTQGPVYLVSVVEKDHERQTKHVHNIFNRDGLYAHIAECGDADNAYRIVAAWNACQGVPTEVLEAQQSGGLPWSVSDQIEARVIQADLLDDLREAAATLRRYEALHRAKNTEDSTKKAEANAALATRFEATIAKAAGESA